MDTNNISYLLRKTVLFSGCIVFLLTGCEKQPESPDDQQVISKKIVMAQKDELRATAPQIEAPSPTDVTVKDEADLVKEPVSESGNNQQASIEPAEEPKTRMQEENQTIKAAETGEVQYEGTNLPPVSQSRDEQISAPDQTGTLPELSKKPEITIGESGAVLAYPYNPAGKIDPFATIFREQPDEMLQTKKTDVNKRVPMTPLERISLSQLKLAAVMLAPSGDKALVEEASGKGYVITQGTYIGTNSGRVVDILMDRIIIEEIAQDLLGKSIAKRTEMMLQKRPGE